MPRIPGKKVVRRPRPDPRDHLSLEERAILKALGVDAVRSDLAKKIKVEAPFSGPEIRAARIKTLIEAAHADAASRVTITLPVSIGQQVKELAKIQDVSVGDVCASLILKGLGGIGLTLDRAKIEAATRRFIAEILLPELAWSGKKEGANGEESDPFEDIEANKLGRGLAAEIKRARRKEESETEE